MSGVTALHRAAMWNKLEAVKFLVTHGAEHRIAYVEGKPLGESAEEAALRYNHKDVATFLAQVGLYMTDWQPSIYLGNSGRTFCEHR